MPHHNEEVMPFDAALQLSIEQATGGACSYNVLGLIGEVVNKIQQGPNSKSRVSADVYGFKIGLLGQVHDLVPDVLLADETLISELGSLLREYSTLSVSERNSIKLELKLGMALKEYRDRYKIPYSTVLDIGTIDISSFEGGNFFCGEINKYKPGAALSSGRRGLTKVRILANKQQSVFSKSGNRYAIEMLYGCVVEGAENAFNGIKEGKRLTAINCTNVFIQIQDSHYDDKTSGELEDCTAVNCGNAFWHYREVNGGIAENCKNVFYNCTEVKKSIAKHCLKAFENRTNDDFVMDGNVAEFTKSAFTYYIGRGHERGDSPNERRQMVKKITNNTVLNPSSYRGNYFRGVRKGSGNKQRSGVNLLHRKNGNRIVNAFTGPWTSIRSKRNAG